MDITSSSLYGQYASLYSENTSSELSSALNMKDNATDEEMMEACKQFEQYFVEQVIKEVKKTIPDDSLLSENEYMNMFEDQFVGTMAEEITKSGQLGFAQRLYENMSAQYGNSKVITSEENAVDGTETAEVISSASKAEEK